MRQVKRREVKYYICYGDYIKLSLLLRGALNYDEHNNKDGGYFIRSVYFDSIFDSAFHEKLEGIEKRQKYRLRIYDPDDQKVKFEVKNKMNNSILKETAVISRADAKEVLDQRYDVLLKYNDPTLNKIYCEFKRIPYRQVIMVDYFREAFTWPINNIRITFDKELSRNSTNLDLFSKTVICPRVYDKSTVIMEVKFDHHLPEWIKDIFKSISFTNNAISKYCLSRMEV